MGRIRWFGCKPRAVFSQLNLYMLHWWWGSCVETASCKVESSLFGEKERWFGCEKSLWWIELSYASGLGGMPMKGRSFGSMSSVKSMVKMMGGRVPARWVRGLVWGCGTIWVAGWPSKWAMGREWDFGWTSGVKMNHFVNPSLPYLPLCLRKAWVTDVWNPKGEGGGWTPLFSRAFNDWELDLVERFLQKIQAIRVHRDVEDKSVQAHILWSIIVLIFQNTRIPECPKAPLS